MASYGVENHVLYFDRDTGGGLGTLALSGMPAAIQLITDSIIAVVHGTTLSSLSLATFGGGPSDFAIG